MRITVSIDDQLLTDAMAATGLTSKHEAIEPRLQTILHLARQEAIHQYSSTISWRDLMDGVQRDRSRHARRQLCELLKQQRRHKRISAPGESGPWRSRQYCVSGSAALDVPMQGDGDVTRFP